ncbi:MAG: c-type cytochrome [Lautropia sp.]
MNDGTNHGRWRRGALVLLALTIGQAAPAVADTDLARSKNCMACHAIDKKLIGPSYKDVAAKYATDQAAAGKLAKKIREGGVGAWGQIPMPANPQVSEAEAARLATWVLGHK